MGRSNWRLYVVILMALFAFNAVDGLFEPRVSAQDTCGSVLMPTEDGRGSGFTSMIGPSFDDGRLACPNTIIRANVEVFVSFLMAALGALSLLISQANERSAAAEDFSHLPNPPGGA